MNPKISIIIPVYGVEKYIVKCIQSIKQQTFEDFEVILINDGTKDRSIEVAKKEIKDDSRFIILHKENGGQGSARNMGLDQARGNYIAFIDSDDYVEQDFLSSMYERILVDNADICTCGVRYIDHKGCTVNLFSNKHDEYEKKKDYLMVSWYISNFMWDKLFHRDIFEFFRFDESLRTNEDVGLIFEIIYGKTITSVPRYLYNYMQNPNTTSKKVPISLIDDRLKIIEKKIKFAELNGFDIDYINYAYLKNFVFITALILVKYSSNYEQDISLLKSKIISSRYSFSNIFKLSLYDRKVFIALLLLKTSPYLFFMLIKFFVKKSF